MRLVLPRLLLVAGLLSCLATAGAAQLQVPSDPGKGGGPIAPSPFEPFPGGGGGGGIPPDGGPPDGGTGPGGGSQDAPDLRGAPNNAGGDRGPRAAGGGSRALASGAGSQAVGYGATDSWQSWWETNKFDFIRLRRIADAPYTGQGRLLEDEAQRVARLKAVHQVLAEQVQPVLRQLTAADDAAVRAAAIVALAKLQDPEASPYARRMLQDGSIEVRRAALLSLGVLDAGRSSYMLMNVADDSEVGRRMLDDSQISDEMRGIALLSAGLRGDRAPEPLFERILSSGAELPNEIVASACESAGLVGALRTMPALTAIARSDSRPEFVRAAATTALGRLGDPAAIPALLALLDDDLEVRRAAALALGLVAHGSQLEVTRRLDALLADSDGPTRHFSAVSLGRIGGEAARDSLGRGFASASGDVRPWLALALGLCERQAPMGDIPRRLLALLDDESNSDTVSAYLIALGLGAQDSAPYPQDLWDKILAALTSHLRGNRSTAAGHAALALGLTGHPQAVSLLQQALASGIAPEVQRQVAYGLGLLGNSSAAPQLIALVQDTGNPYVASAAAIGIGFLGDVDAVGPLLHIIERNGPSGLATTYSVVALGQLFDDERRPVLARLAAGDNYLARPSSVSQLLALGF